MIALEQVVHRYRRGPAALDGVSLSIAEGQCFGLIGSNGAGKTTTMRILATLIAPTSGRVTIAGHDVVTDYLTVRRMIGYMPEAFAVFRELTVDEFLDYTAAAYGFRGDEKRQRVDGVIELTDLSTKRTSSCDALSRGMKQRLLLARALVHDPRVLILDEPTAGLDPAARVEFRQIMRGLTAAGKTIIISSHILPELAEFCTSVGIMERGRVVASGSIAEMLSTIRGPRAILVEVAGDGQFAGSILRAQPGVDAARVDGSHIVVSYTGRREELPALLRALVSAGVAVASFSERQSSLEDIFMKVAAFEVG